MNPYDFVHIDWETGVGRRPPRPHNRFDGLSGQIKGTIKTLTPLFIPDSRKLSPRRFLTNRQGQHIIPGSSLKGLVRSLVETIGPGCWWLFKGEHEDKLPKDFRQCRYQDKLCVACRMFGLIQDGTLLLGHVGFEDAVCEEPRGYDPIYTPILSAPKPRHIAWYLDSTGRQVAGRKFYFHSTEIRALQEIKRSKSGVELNQYIAPVGPDSVFTFSAHFDNLAKDEFGLLLYALALERGMRHKIGYAKPAGLGSVEIALTRLALIDYRRRYTSPNGGKNVYKGNELEDFVQGWVAPYANDETSVTLRDLRRIWAWPPPEDIQYGYPTEKWFDENPSAPISATIDVPRQ